MISNSFSQQNVSLDWKMHNVGQVRQFVSNIGSLWPTGWLLDDFPHLIYCEFPPNSFEEHVGEGGIWVGALVGGDTLVSVTTSWHSSVEFFPSSAHDDTVWVVLNKDTVDIPYWPGYVGRSDQDFVCKYSDYNVSSVALHEPLYIDIIQTSYAWSSAPLDEFIFYNFYVIPMQNNLKDIYIAYWMDGNVGYRTVGWDFALDDYTVYYEDRHMGVSIDASGHADGTAYSPIGIRMFPPENEPEDSIRWTFNWIENPNFGPPGRDGERYEWMAADNIMQNQNTRAGSQFFISFGPFDLIVGDTLHFMVGEVFGEGLDGLLDNADRLDWLIQNNFHVPSPPPRPPLRIVEKSHQVELSWEALPGDVDPETYWDPYRADSMEVPFEGYRVYKSTQSATGPWTLLAEYDIDNNNYGHDVGLFRDFKDLGLLNNLEYYYTVTAFSKPDTVIDWPSQESSLNANAVTVIPATAPPTAVGNVAVVPNPYRGDIAYHTFNPPWEKPGATRERWMEQDRRLQFINVPQNCQIRIYTLAGDFVAKLLPVTGRGFVDWNLTSDVGQAVSSGIYLFTVEDNNTGEVQVGKFVIIK